MSVANKLTRESVRYFFVGKIPFLPSDDGGGGGGVVKIAKIDLKQECALTNYKSTPTAVDVARARAVRRRLRCFLVVLVPAANCSAKPAPRRGRSV